MLGQLGGQLKLDMRIKIGQLKIQYTTMYLCNPVKLIEHESKRKTDQMVTVEYGRPCHGGI